MERSTMLHLSYSMMLFLLRSLFIAGRNPFPDVKTHICLDQCVLALSADRPLKDEKPVVSN